MTWFLVLAHSKHPPARENGVAAVSPPVPSSSPEPPPVRSTPHLPAPWCRALGWRPDAVRPRGTRRRPGGARRPGGGPRPGLGGTRPGVARRPVNLRASGLSRPVAVLPRHLRRGIGPALLRQPIRHPLQARRRTVASAATKPHRLVAGGIGQCQDCAEPKLVSSPAAPWRRARHVLPWHQRSGLFQLRQPTHNPPRQPASERLRRS